MSTGAPSPAPMTLSWEQSLVGGATQHVTAGHPGATEIFKMLAFDAEQKVKAGTGAITKERIRVLWANLVPTWCDPFTAWLAEEWGANVVMDFQGYTPYAHIDTSTEHSMLLGIAKRSVAEVPMIRQARSTVDVMIEDVTRIAKDYNVIRILPRSCGTQDQSASIGFLKEACRDLKLPLLILSVDKFDPRFTPLDVLKRQVSQFFSAQGLG